MLLYLNVIVLNRLGNVFLQSTVRQRARKKTYLTNK